MTDKEFNALKTKANRIRAKAYYQSNREAIRDRVRGLQVKNREELPQEPADKLKAWRKRNGYRLSDAAEMFGVVTSTVCSWECRYSKVPERVMEVVNRDLQ